MTVWGLVLALGCGSEPATAVLDVPTEAAVALIADARTLCSEGLRAVLDEDWDGVRARLEALQGLPEPAACIDRLKASLPQPEGRPRVRSAPDARVQESDVDLETLIERAELQISRHRFTKADATLREAEAKAPDSVRVLVLQAGVATSLQDHDRAEERIRRAVRLAPDDPDVQEVATAVRAARSAEGDHGRVQVENFDVRYDRELSAAARASLLSALRDARRSVGRDLGLRSDEKMVVVFYEADAFRARTGAPHQVLGLYDGTIRLPVRDGAESRTQQRATVHHEVTHAVVYQLTNGHAPRWLQEGLAEVQESRISAPDTSLITLLVEHDVTLTMNQLGDRSSVWRHEIYAQIAYAQSYVMCRYLVDRYGWSTLQRVLAGLGDGTDAATALSRVTGRTPEQFAHEWERDVLTVARQRGR